MYEFNGEWERILGLADLPSSPGPLQGSSRRDDLWKSTCLEWFLQGPSGTAYWEANYSPQGLWNLYALSDYRKDLQPETRASAPQVRICRDGSALQIGLTFDLGFLSADLASEWKFAPAAVIEDIDGVKSYWSLKHTQEHPDFHHADHRTARLIPED